jgi:hypothetical protein
MDRLEIELKNCYGIKSFNDNQHFDFSKDSTFAIYASNGSMKTSLANTFLDLSKGDKPEERFFKGDLKYTVCKDGNEIEAKDIFVVEAELNKEREGIEKSATLLVNQDLKKDYKQARKDIEEAQNTLLEELKKLSGLSSEKIEDNLCNVFESDSFLQAVEYAYKELTEGKSPGFSQIVYKEIFNRQRDRNGGIEKLLNEEDFKQNIETYSQKYEELISESQYLQSDFNYNNIKAVKDALEENNYFEPGHSLRLRSDSDKGGNDKDNGVNYIRSN